MVKQIYICDRCGKEMTPETHEIHIDRFDFCSKCKDKLLDVLSKFVESEIREDNAEDKKIIVEDKNEPRISDKKRYNKDIVMDWDKACSLKLAGWKNVQIAEEFGRTKKYIDSAIYKYLDEYKKKRGIK